MIQAHEQKRTITEIVITPDHADRTTSAEFRHSVERLKADGHYRCWVCGVIENLQVHHFGCEWSLQNVCDFEKLKAFCEEWDPYGYGKLLKNIPMTSADDVRNMLVLCQEHHTGVDHEDGNSGTGIHSLSFPIFVIQKIAKQGEDPVPQNTQTAGEVLKEIEQTN